MVKSAKSEPAARLESFPTGGAQTEPVTLRQLLDNLGPRVAGVIVAPRGLDVAVEEPVIHDPFGGATIQPGAIVFAVGTAPDTLEARSLIATAGAAEAAVVVFKMHGRACEWISEAEQAGLTVVSIADEMSWSHINALVSLTLPSLRQSASIPGMASVPLGDLFALANAIAGLVGGAITIEDQRARVLAYSNLEGQLIDEPRQQSILGRQVPDTPGIRALYKRLWHSDSVIRVDHVEDFEIFPRIAVRITVGNQTLGSLWAVEGKTLLGKEAEQALEEAARVTSLHMIHARSSRDIERSIQGDLLRSLLEGRGDVAGVAGRLGIDRRSPLIVLAFEIMADERIEEFHRERLVDLVATYSEAFRLRAACVAIDSTVFSLLPVSDRMDDDRVKQIALEIHEHAESALDLPLQTAISSVVTDVRNLPNAWREVKRILTVLGTEPERKLASVEDVRSRVTLLTLHELARDHPDLLTGSVEAIARHDIERKTSYMETLSAYLSAFGDVPTAAAATNVHPNTFRYRLRRLTELFDIDLQNPEDRLVTELQVWLLNPRPGGSPGSARHQDRLRR
ncbi:MAG: PucR family transcriptional regulator [Actinomycetota bacterium]